MDRPTSSTDPFAAGQLGSSALRNRVIEAASFDGLGTTTPGGCVTA